MQKDRNRIHKAQVSEKQRPIDSFVSKPSEKVKQESIADPMPAFANNIDSKSVQDIDKEINAHIPLGNSDISIKKPSNRDFTPLETQDIHKVFEKLSNFDDGQKMKFIDACTMNNYNDFKFPRSGSRNSSCQAKWLRGNEDWLIYSESNDSLHCLSCLMFPPATPSKSNLTLKSGFRNWPCAIARISSHNGLDTHKLSLAKLEAFRDNRRNPTKAINMRMSRAEAELIAKSRCRLRTIKVCHISR